MTWLAQFAALLSPRSATASPVFIRSNPSADTSGPASNADQRQRPAGAERTAMIARRATRLHNRNRDKARSYEAVHRILAEGRG